MRFERLTIHGFGPFPKTETIDFGKLSSSGLFLITGPIGAGKTTMLDAICFALYGQTTGEGQASGALDGRSGTELRCSRSAPDQETKVELVFRVKDSFFKIERSPEYSRPKRRGEGTTRTPASVHLYRWDSAAIFSPSESNELSAEHLNWQPISSRVADVASEVESITGFNAEQFRRVIVIPQGRFRDVLISPHDARQDLLKKIFGTEVFERFSLKTMECEQRRKAAWMDHQRSFEDLLAQFPWTNGLTSEEVQTRIDADLQSAQEQLAAAETQKNDSELKLAESNRALGAAQAIVRLCDSIRLEETKLQKAEGELRELERIRPEWENAKAAALVADKLSRFRNIERQLQQDVAALETLVTRSTEVKLHLENHQLALQKANQEFESVGEINLRLGQIAEREQQVQQDKKRWVNAEQAVEKAKANAAKTTQEWDNLQRQLPHAEKSLAESKHKYEAAMARFHAGSAARLAATLASGEACPVCGSHEHPSPATSAERIPSEDALKLLQDAMNCENDELQRLSLALATTREQERNSQHAVVAAQETLSETPPPLDISELVREAQTLKSRRDEIIRAKDLAEREARAASEQSNKVELEIAQKKATIETLQSQSTIARKELDSALSLSSLKTVNAVDAATRETEWISKIEREVNNATKALQAATSSLDALRSTLGDRRPPNMQQLELDHAAIASALMDIEKSTAAAKQSRDALAAFNIQYAERYQQKASSEKEYQTALTLSQMVNGKTPGGDRVSLHSWVLASVMEQVLAQSTSILRHMTRGRYELIRSTITTGGTGQKGLEISVSDTWNGTTRPARTLSGGETFLASLALSLALAQTAASYQGGRPLETVFIDEGFGSLDAESLEAAVSALTSLREQGRVVGIISHVDEMRRTIGTQLRFTRIGETVQTEIIG